MHNLIFKNDTLKIIQDENNNTIYKIKFNYKCPSLVRSLIKTQIIKGGTVTDDYLCVRFKALSIVPFLQQKSISINLAAKMLSDLTTQLSHLIKNESKTILGYALENIIVINGDTFAFVDSELVADINPEGKEMATISCPFNVTDFFASPELLRITELPSQVHYKTAYFSLGCLLLSTLTKEGIKDVSFYKEYLQLYKSKELQCFKIHEHLDKLPIKDTKFYWLLSRCLVEDPEKRNLLFI